jgi:hypothetical protein
VAGEAENVMKVFSGALAGHFVAQLLDPIAILCCILKRLLLRRRLHLNLQLLDQLRNIFQENIIAMLLHLVQLLRIKPPRRLLNRLGHTIRHIVRRQDRLAPNMARRPAHGFDQRAYRWSMTSRRPSAPPTATPKQPNAPAS